MAEPFYMRWFKRPPQDPKDFEHYLGLRTLLASDSEAGKALRRRLGITKPLWMEGVKKPPQALARYQALCNVLASESEAGKALRRRLGSDLSALWAHALQELLVAWLQRSSPVVQDKIINSLEEYFHLLEHDYWKWIKEEPEGQIDDYLSGTSPPKFPHKLSGGPRKKRSEPPQDDFNVQQAHYDYQITLRMLNETLKKKYNGQAHRIRDIKTALQKTSVTPEAIPQQMFNHWGSLSLPAETIALEVAAWKHKRSPLYLQRQFSNAADGMAQEILSSLHTLAEGFDPLAREVYQKPRALRERVQSSKNPHRTALK